MKSTEPKQSSALRRGCVAVALLLVLLWVVFPHSNSGRVPTLELVHYHNPGSTNGYMVHASLMLKNDTGETITVVGNPKRVSAFLGQLGKQNQFSQQFPRNVVLRDGEDCVFDVAVWNAAMPWVASVEYVEGSHSGRRNSLAQVLPSFLEQWIWQKEISQRALAVATIPAANNGNTAHEMARK